MYDLFTVRGPPEGSGLGMLDVMLRRTHLRHWVCGQPLRALLHSAPRAVATSSISNTGRAGLWAPLPQCQAVLVSIPEAACGP